jgi:hypothetical protein
VFRKRFYTQLGEADAAVWGSRHPPGNGSNLRKNDYIYMSYEYPKRGGSKLYTVAFTEKQKETGLVQLINEL